MTNKKILNSVMVILKVTQIVAVLYVLNGAQSEMFYYECGQLKAMKNFTMDRFTGSWNVVKVKASPLYHKLACIKYLIKAKHGLYYKYYSINRYRLIDDEPEDTYLVAGGPLILPNPEKPEDMSVSEDMFEQTSFPTFTIIDTDYDNYAVKVTCDGEFLSFAIMSRTKTIAQKFNKKIRAGMNNRGIHLNDVEDVDQSNCNKASEKAVLFNTINNTITYIHDKTVKVPKEKITYLDNWIRKFI